MTEHEAAELRSLKASLGNEVIIAAHHYQQPEIVGMADLVGDSYKLALEASRTRAEYIVLCGVLFMAESAAILAQEGQKVLIPDTFAGCPMADMIDSRMAREIFTHLSSLCKKPIVPVTYMNSYGDLKSFTGETGGSICTSSNAEKILRFYFETGKAVFFMPDRNLGLNTAIAMGMDEGRIFTVRKDGKVEGTGDPADGLIYLWDGYCHVHKRFKVSDIETARANNPGIRVIVHPECDREVVEASDLNGSTERIYKEIAASPPGSRWAVGTEGSFVARMAIDFPDRTILPLRVSICLNMSRIRIDNLRSSLLSIQAHRSRGDPLLFQVTVPREHKRNAELALATMIHCTEGRP